MSYFIKASYPELTISKPATPYDSWLGEYKIIDNNDTWTFLCDFYIYGNYYLPPNSFVGNFKTFFATVNNIPLIWEETILVKKIGDTQAYNIEKYSMSFDLAISNSSYFKNFIIKQSIPFEIGINFNTQKLTDYKIDVTQTNLDQFILETLKRKHNSEFLYSNYYNLNDVYDRINFSLKGDEQKIVDFYSYNLVDSESINKILRISKFDNEPLFIQNKKININYRIKNESLLKHFSMTLENTIHYENEFDLELNNEIYFDYSKNELIQNTNYDISNGFFIPFESYGEIIFEFDIIYHNKKRHFLLNRQFSFEKNIESMLNEKIILTNSEINRTLYFEAQNENIY